MTKCCNEGCSLPSTGSNEYEIALDQLKKEVKKLMETTTARLLCQDKKIADTCVYIKDNLSNAIRELLDNMLSSGELDDIITDVINDTIELLEFKLNDIFTLEEFGGIGNGTSNNANALNEALAQNTNKNKIIRLKDKIYGATGKIYLYSNTTIDLNNGTIRNIGDSESRLTFLNNIISVKTPGYGALKNIVIKNGTIEGCDSGVVFALLHGENIEINNVTFKNCCVTNHIFDLGGCKNIRFINCRFTGCTLSSDLDYRELIQPDYARYAGLPYWGESEDYAYDNLECQDLLFDGCSFEKGDGDTYPNAIGTHSIGDNPHSNIIIRNCQFYDNTYACIRFPKVKNLLIEHNEFYNINRDSSRGNTYFINLVALNSSNYALNLTEDVRIINNKFLVDGGIGNGIGITFRGFNTEQIVKDLVVRDNYFESTYGDNSDGADALHTGNSDNVTFDNNTMYKIKNCFLQITSTQLHNVKFINNTMKYCRDSIRGGSNALELGMSNNIWVDSTGSINLNSFITTVTISNDVTTSENVTRNIPYNVCDNPFFTINSNNAINIPKQFKRVKVTAYAMIHIDSEGDGPIFKTGILEIENLSTDTKITNYCTGAFDFNLDRCFPILTNEESDITLDDRIIRVSHRFTQTPNETLLAKGTKLIIEGY